MPLVLTRLLVNVVCVFLHYLFESTLAQLVVVFFQLRTGWCSCHVALLALSRDAAAASQLAVHSDFPSRCFFVFALLLVDVTRLRQVVLIGCFFCASALPSFEVSGCLVRFMSISYFLSRGKPRPLLAPLLFASAFLHTFCLPRQAP